MRVRSLPLVVLALSACATTDGIDPPAPTLTQVVLTPATASLQTGATQQFSASGRLSDGSTSAVTVTYGATGGTITAGGLYTAGTTAGSFRVIATQQGGPLADTSAVTVTALAPAPVASVTVSPASAAVVAGGTQQLTATLRDAAGSTLTGRTVTWSSGNGAVATVSASGLVSAVAAGSATITATSEGQQGSSALTVTAAPAGADTVFVETFESGTLTQWQDGVNPTLHKVLTDPAFARSGTRYLEITYPVGQDAGWLTRFFMPGYDAIRVSYWFRLSANWQGNTKLIALRGSRTDNQWSASGQAGQCPTGSDFFDATVFLEAPAPQALRFYTYYPGMPKQPDGVTCWGVSGDGSEQYTLRTVSKDVWHHLEFEVRLNAPGQNTA